ncbi:MAG TPA: Zn-dependent alcohol dehydrogenase [Tepidisphaeraceae bacterium]|jgi:S-(hydroxymethyl)glutathione dehydrogenase/alcohol dehydrogenase
MKIKAAILRTANTAFSIEDPELDPPRAGEVLVRIRAVGVCHSDWHLVTGATKHPMPVVAGHEGAGVIEAVGADVGDLQVGDHVILNWAPSCGRCFYCKHEKPNLCDTYTGPIWAGTMLDGTTRLRLGGETVYSYCGLAAFAERTVVPHQSCVKIRDDVAFDAAALVGCAVATGVGAVMFTAQVKKGESVAVIGCGGVGMSSILGAVLCGAKTIIAIDVNEKKLQMARQIGATHCVPGSSDVAAQVRSLTDGRGADHAIEAVGIPALQELALNLARPGGTVILAGLSPMGSSTNLPGAIIVRQEKTIKGSYYGGVNAPRDFPMLIDLYAKGQLKLDQLISKRYRLEQINEAFADMLSGEITRGVIVL